eukprot:6681561-Prymnesium_polylepis.2
MAPPRAWWEAIMSRDDRRALRPDLRARSRARSRSGDSIRLGEGRSHPGGWVAGAAGNRVRVS